MVVPTNSPANRPAHEIEMAGQTSKFAHAPQYRRATWAAFHRGAKHCPTRYAPQYRKATMANLHSFAGWRCTAISTDHAHRSTRSHEVTGNHRTITARDNKCTAKRLSRNVALRRHTNEFYKFPITKISPRPLIKLSQTAYKIIPDRL